MPRFPETSVDYLKRTMLACSARDFRFNAYDVEAIVNETELNQAQVQVWADNFRFRNGTNEERLEYLRSAEKDGSNKVSRFFVSCFNVTPEFATKFSFQKSKGCGDFSIKYIEAAFNKEAESGEFFFEFEEKVWEHKLIESFQSQGAGQVSTITFANNDGGDSASNALLRILSSQAKTGISYSRGTCPPALLAKVQAKQAAAALAQASSSSKEFDEKTMAAIKQSMEQHAAVMVKVEGGLQSQVVKLDGIQDGMQSQVVKLDGIENGMQSQVVKLDGIENGMQSQVVKIEDIQNRVCNVILDYQNEIKSLKEALAHKTKLCDRIEGQKGRLTMEINKLKWDLGEKADTNESLNREKFVMGKKIQDLQMQLDMCQSIALLKQMQEETQRTAEILASTLADERAAKRQRA